MTIRVYEIAPGISTPGVGPLLLIPHRERVYHISIVGTGNAQFRLEGGSDPNLTNYPMATLFDGPGGAGAAYNGVHLVEGASPVYLVRYNLVSIDANTSVFCRVSYGDGVTGVGVNILE